MPYRNIRGEFLALMVFVVCLGMLLTNGFSARIFAQNDDTLIYDQIEPIGEVLAEILDNYVYPPDMEKAVEGALMGIMSSLDRNSSFVPARAFKSMQEDTRGDFDGIGVRIKYHESGNILVFQPIPGAPAAKAGFKAGDYIVEVDGVDIPSEVGGATTRQEQGEALNTVSERIKGPRGTSVNITVSREIEGSDERGRFEFKVKRGKIPLRSIVEARILDHGVGYIRVSDFKRNTADDVKKLVREFEDENLSALILDLRWNPGGLLTASRELCELFLPKRSLVTYTRGRPQDNGEYLDDMRLYTEKNPIIPESMPIIVLVSRGSASSSEIVTGALQYHERAIVIGEKTFGKGSVQTVIPLTSPPGSALRLTTALYYTPADVTIDQVGILPDLEIEMDLNTQNSMRIQMSDSIEAGPEFINKQNHGRITGNVKEGAPEPGNPKPGDAKESDAAQVNAPLTGGSEAGFEFRRPDPDEEPIGYINDTVLERAVTLLREEPSFAQMLEKFHRDVSETQTMASQELRDKKVR